MIDQKLLPIVSRFTAPIAIVLAKRNVTANQVTIAGFVMGILAVPFIATGHYFWGLIFILINRIFDGIDGELARKIEPTDRGAFLDISLDFIFYAAVPLGFAMSNASNLLPACFLLFSFIGTGTSFLSFSLLAERQGLTSIQYPNKGIYYLGGITEGFETILFFVLICLFPMQFPIMAYIFSAACVLTATMRIYFGYQTLSGHA